MLGYSITQTIVAPLAKLRIRELTGVKCLPQTGPAIIAINHASWFDPLTFGGAIYPTFRRTMHFVAITNNWWWLGALPIDHAHPGDILRSAKLGLEQGRVMAIFPEGYRNSHPDMPRGKTGVARLALWTGAPVIPVGIRCLPGSSLREMAKNFRLTRHTSIHIGTPLLFPKMDEETITNEVLRRTTADIMRAIAQLAGKTYSYS